ncbi:uncharacterized protein LOC110626781 [Manihot esculenta]|uniref:Uncharacterized protein n=2 Tax=Manihot esculenta TaxID=3983 RepID=A0A251KAU7_MANES|nr:uncharacterized protein LOC110626781 [Manihot esculenta]KAG8644312.1 hypothetical protein MANES_11G117600v8 [Manihot esculenta]OAY37644.1 hypothetical protein MANES_11G117600v8 [Manihot esculenta]OAY37645.1 hypothetical protein MANES_11G117600v8 [Manihot esculenta]OAY37646.1 hypothetical protein MANES_11G117600v8 [Manihot esculenta]
MVGISCEQDSWVSSRNLNQEEDQTESSYSQANPDQGDVFYEETDEIWQKVNQAAINNHDNSCSRGTFSSKSRSNSKKKKNQVLLEGYVEVANTNEDDLKRTKSLTDDDLDELKGCLDLGFGFSYDEIPELCNTLPALELCYSMSQKFLDEQHKSPERSSPAAETASSPIANWKISSPGDHPEDVKARLKFWAQAVACTVRLCS